MEELKGNHSKVKNIEYENISMQKYLKPNRCEMSLADAQLIFRLRCRMTNVKMNLKGAYDNLECTACGLEEETQIHLVNCQKLNEKRVKKSFDYKKIIRKVAFCLAKFFTSRYAPVLQQSIQWIQNFIKSYLDPLRY